MKGGGAASLGTFCSMGKKILVGVNYPGVEKILAAEGGRQIFREKNLEKSRKTEKNQENSEKIKKNHENDPRGVNPGKKVLMKLPRE